MREVEPALAPELAEQPPDPPDGPRAVLQTGRAVRAAQEMHMHARRRLVAEVQALRGDVDLVPPGRQLADEPERYEAIAVRLVVRQQRGRGHDEDRKGRVTHHGAEKGPVSLLLCLPGTL